jgi:hypothetical protein
MIASSLGFSASAKSRLVRSQWADVVRVGKANLLFQSPQHSRSD